MSDALEEIRDERRAQHPVKDIVLPLAVVIGLITNALFVGIAWGKINYRMEISEREIALQREVAKEQNREIESLKDRAHDIERDRKDDLRNFLILDNYTRGRIDHMPYKSPPPYVHGND